MPPAISDTNNHIGQGVKINKKYEFTHFFISCFLIDNQIILLLGYNKYFDSGFIVQNYKLNKFVFNSSELYKLVDIFSSNWTLY